MADWSCRDCDEGMIWDEERNAMVLCRCPNGEAKRRYLEMSPEERRRRANARGRKPKDEPKDATPF